MGRTLQIAWRNLGRSKKRTGLALLAIAVGQFALLATSGLMHGYADNIQAAITGPMIGHVQIHDPNWRDERALDLMLQDVNALLQTVAAYPQVESVAARIYSPVLVAPQQEAFVAMIVGVEPEVESREYGLLSGLDTPLEPGKVLIGYRLARKMQVEPGQEIAVIGQSVDGFMANALYRIQDVIRCPADMVNLSGIVMSLADAQTFLAMPDSAHEIVVRTGPLVDSQGLADALTQAPQLAGTEILAWQQIVPELVIVIKSADFTAYFVLVLVFIAALAGIANTLMMSTFERTHEFGMLLSLGCRPGRIALMIVMEALLIALLGILLGTILGYAFVAVTEESGIDMAFRGDSEADDLAFKGLALPLNVYPRLEPGDSLRGVVAILLTSLIASIWPTWVAVRLEPMEAMRQ
ncbi:MAG: ABC transporter permease [Planctomycetes bacterium]|nr:ABC transporter permease [Planctomycetota bacterium]